MTSPAQQLLRNIGKYNFEHTKNDEQFYARRTNVSKIPTYVRTEKEITQKRNSKLDLNSLLIGNPDCTFLIKVTGDSMTKAGINTGDIILVDRSIKAKTGNIVVATINNKLLVKRLILNENGIELLSENDSFPNIKIKESDKFNIWGVVKSIIKQV